MAIPSLENFRSDIAKQQNGSLSPRANLRLRIRVTCIQGDGIRHFCAVSASSVGSDGASLNSVQKLGCISNAAKDCLPNIMTETKLSVPIDVNLVSKGCAILSSCTCNWMNEYPDCSYEIFSGHILLLEAGANLRIRMNLLFITLRPWKRVSTDT